MRSELTVNTDTVDRPLQPGRETNPFRNDIHELHLRKL